MPYAGDVYSLPPGTSATSNTTILSAMFNAFVADIAAAQNAARPIAVGGTGAATVGAAFDNLHTASSNIASATTTDLSTATGYYVQITGTTTITGFGTEVAGVPRFLRFADALTLTHNATSLILPTGANITTAADDTAIMVSEGSGNWRCIAYQRASGAALAGSSAASTTEVLTGTDTAKAVTPDALAALWEKGSNVASATTITLGEGGMFHITGTTTITDIDFATAKDGRTATLIFDGALTLTHNATTLVLPGGANITTAAGDRCTIVQDGSDNIYVTNYTRAAANPLVAPSTSGNVLTSNGSAWVSSAPADSGIPIPTTSTLPVGFAALMYRGDAGSTADGATVAGSLLKTLGTNSAGSLATGATQTGTWKNISGNTSSSVQYVLFVRIA